MNRMIRDIKIIVQARLSYKFVMACVGFKADHESS